jgi:hypothetical protein
VTNRASVRTLDDDTLIDRLPALAAREREAAAAFVAHLAELEARDLHLRQGYPSLFVYCRDLLGLSEHDAFGLVAAARAARRFPMILDRLARGTIHLTAVRLLAPYLTAENHVQVLDLARGKRRAQIDEIVAMLAPLPDVPPSIQRLSPPPVAPLSPGRYRVQLTIGGDTVERLRLARDMLRHTLPAGDDAAVFDRALGTLLAELAKKKFAATDRPRAPRPSEATSRHVPAEVKRAVWLRDLGRCAFVGAGGHLCRERGFLEFHHVTPHAAGGPPTVANIELRCRRHNDYEARAYFGPDVAREATGGLYAAIRLPQAGARSGDSSVNAEIAT